MDLKVKGCNYTWVSNLKDGRVTKERIDRMVANWEWHKEFPNAYVMQSKPYLQIIVPSFYSSDQRWDEGMCLSMKSSGMTMQIVKKL